MNVKSKARLQQLTHPRLRSIRRPVCHGHWHVFLAAPLPRGACQETLAEGCSAACDTSAVIAVTSPSPGQEVMQVTFMQLPAALDT